MTPNPAEAAEQVEAARPTWHAPAIASALAAAGADRWLNTQERALIEQFWQQAGIQLVYPRTLERVVSMALPVFIVRIPKLCPRFANDWLRSRGKVSLFASEDAKTSGAKHSELERRVHGCYVGSKGWGFIFIDGTDSDDEARFTLAHETAHFLVDYHQPRQNAIVRYGESIIPVLDEERAATFRERFRFIRDGLPVLNRTNFMQRDLTGSAALELVGIEDRADRIALALLVPPLEVLSATLDAPHAEQLAHLKQLLVHDYGLPAQPAALYALGLLDCIGSTPSSWQALRGHVSHKIATDSP